MAPTPFSSALIVDGKDVEWKSLVPLGVKFRPTVEELLTVYLGQKVAGDKIRPGIISEVDLYRHEPWELQAYAFDHGDGNLYFFTRNSKQKSRTKRETEYGFWKGTQTRKDVNSVGTKTPLAYHWNNILPNQAKKEPVKTPWLMTEFRMPKSVTDHDEQEEEWALCVVHFHKPKEDKGTHKLYSPPDWLEGLPRQYLCPQNITENVMMAPHHNTATSNGRGPTLPPDLIPESPPRRYLCPQIAKNVMTMAPPHNTASSNGRGPTLPPDLIMEGPSRQYLYPKPPRIHTRHCFTSKYMPYGPYPLIRGKAATYDPDMASSISSLPNLDIAPNNPPDIDFYLDYNILELCDQLLPPLGYDDSCPTMYTSS